MGEVGVVASTKKTTSISSSNSGFGGRFLRWLPPPKHYIVRRAAR